MKRVVITGMAGISPIGSDWQTVSGNLENGRNGIRAMADWERYSGLNTLLGAPVVDFEKPSHYPRRAVRGMGRVALMATRASELALDDAGLLEDESIRDGRMGVSYGSSTGSTKAVTEFATMLLDDVVDGLTATSYIRMMPHTAPVNIGVFFGLKGRVITTSSACTSGSQGIGYAYEAIKFGRQTMMLAGGAEELCPTEAAVFDTLYATSTVNDSPESTPRPFDSERDGLVIGEGAGTLVLEELEHALARGAHIYGEIVGFGTNSDGAHITQPTRETMRQVMERSLDDADLDTSAIGYVSAHGTATDRGDIAESHATHDMFGNRAPISALKSYTGHTLGACGALESWVALEMMNRNRFHHTLNLSKVDPECADLDYIVNEPREIDCEYVMSNNFAFGGINTSLIFRRWLK
ncbi:MAG: beta-ketoacyl-ACP synthase [Marinobacter sp.]|uniref:beta-ketoacyl-ACP synthase n=1 Tax=Marinobacter sp. TaxID=50741 RepID=UPI003F96EFB9